ncbi:MAG: hypothetical protein WBF49_13790, partial [Methyloceanibacter sp.]
MAASDGRKAGDLGRFCLTVTSSFFCCPRAADCEAGEFTNFVGKKYQFKGKSSQSGSLARKRQTSIIGTFRTSHLHRRLSALGGKADMRRTGCYVSY